MATALDTIVPIILIFIGVVFVWSKFGEPIKNFIDWIKSKFSSGRDRFQPVKMAKELTYQ